MRPIARAALRLAATGMLLIPTTASAASGGGATVTPTPAAAPATTGTGTALESTPITLTRTQLRSVQRRLRLRADGVLGSKTKASLRRYQRKQELTVTGRPNVETLRALGLKVAERYAARLAAQASTATTDAATIPPTALAGVAGAIEAARSRVGDPYRSGGTKPGGFDCSGLMVWAFGEAGIDLPRTSFQQYREGVAITKSQIQAGDLVFFDSAGAGASHVGVATGPTKVISATTKGVMEHTIASGYWASHYVGARRLVATT
ncbi:MAG: C40 family peptidase [Solirubrobacteraceae bacterium]|nr:C40 family peptidase [Solirubrobacteraceae bacterium]